MSDELVTLNVPKEALTLLVAGLWHIKEIDRYNDSMTDAEYEAQHELIKAVVKEMAPHMDRKKLTMAFPEDDYLR